MNVLENTVYGRFKSLPWFNPITKSRIIIFGQGGIGSWLTLFLARAGASIIIVDMDKVERVNIAGQVYGETEVGKSKVQAMKDVVNKLCGESKITAVNIKVDPDEESWKTYLSISDVVCTSFDSIAARKMVYEEWIKIGKSTSLFVDGRMGVENGQVFTLERVGKELSKTNKDHYEDSFFDDNSIEEAPCTAKATSHCGALIASLMTAQITNWFNNLQSGVMPRTLSSQLDFYLPVMLFENKVVVPEPKKEEDVEETTMV